jgi:uncharacterized protein (DUF58 family)
MFLMINFGVGFAALNTGNNLLYLVLSLLLAFLTLSGFLSEAALRGLQVRRTLPGEMFAGQPNAVRIEVRNRQRKVPAFAIVVEDRVAPPPEVEDPIDGDWRLTRDRDIPVVGRIFALRISPGDVQTRRYTLEPERRGPLVFHSVRVSTRFPFGLFLKSRTIRASGEALVYPHVEALASPSPRFGGEGNTEAPARARQGGDDVSGLREWAPGDALRHVHWRSSLRRGQLTVRTFDEERHAEIEVRLRTAGVHPGDAFEQQVSWAASEVVAQLAAGMRVGLLTDDDHLAPADGRRQRTRLLSHLARVQPRGTSDREPLAHRVETDTAEGASSGLHTDIDDNRRAETRRS